MLGKEPNNIYDPFLKAVLGYKNPERLKKAIEAQPKMYDCERIHSANLKIDSSDSEETLEDAKKNQDLLITISELKNKLKTIDKGKNVNTKFDKSETSGTLLCVTPLPKNITVKANKVSNSKINTNRSKPVISHPSPKNEQGQKQNENVLPKGMYRITKTETRTSDSKTNINVSNSIGVESSNSVRRPKYKDNKSKNIVLKNTNAKSSTAHVRKMSRSVNIDSNKRETMHSNLVLWIVDSECSKHMTGNLQLLRNFVEKFMRTFRFGDDHFTAITGYGEYAQGNLMICHVYYVEGLRYKLILVGQFCEGDLEVAFHSNTCYVRNLKACEQGKSKKASLPPKLVPSTESKLKLIHMDLCGPMRVASINGKKYILVIVDDYSRYIWVYFLRTKDEASDMIIDFINQVQRNLKAQILMIRTDNRTEFKNKKLWAFYAKLASSVVEEDEAPQIVSSSADQIVTEPNSPVLNQNTDELVQEDDAEFDGNVFYNPPQTPMFEEAESSSTF
ncbi:integrase, catalytic region, zinc finger, CCHC-type containing protein [Tanacetum coccineum]